MAAADSCRLQQVNPLWSQPLDSKQLHLCVAFSRWLQHVQMAALNTREVHLPVWWMVFALGSMASREGPTETIRKPNLLIPQVLSLFKATCASE